MSFQVQELLHSLTAGAGARLLRALFVLIVVAALGALYDALAFRNFSNREAMDMAQLGKNLAEGRGYTTLHVRPFSMFLVARHRPDQSALLKTGHPDIAHPPVYPWLLAGLFRLLPERYFVAVPKDFSIYWPELAVAVLNQGLLLLAGLLLFLLAAKYFDRAVAWVTLAVFFGTELLWRFTVSGLNTTLLLVVGLGLAWGLARLEHWTRLGRSDVQLVLTALGVGALAGLGGLTRYAFGWVLVPALVYVIAFTGAKRAVLVLAMVAGFLAVMAPWVYRNYQECGLPFGTATFTVCEDTVAFPGDRLQRSLHPDLRTVTWVDFSRKFLANTREIVQNDLPRLGGSWVTAFFLVGLLVPFRSLTLSRLRWFLLFTLGTFLVVQAMGRTVVSSESPEINSENLLVLVTPLVILYGVALFFLLLDSIALPFPAARAVLTGGFCLVASLPLVQELLPPNPSPIVYPPYYPPLLQRIAGWFNADEMLMSDMPWAMAWYGRRQTVAVTLNWKKDFIEITDFHKPIKGLYLTPLTTDSKFLSNWVKGENHSWAAFLLESLVQREVPTGFPLRRAPEGFFPEQLLLTDYERWKLRRE